MKTVSSAGSPLPRLAIPFGVPLLLAALSFGNLARADNNLRLEMEAVAKGISAELKEIGKSKVDVRGFDFKGSDSRLRGASGPGISQVLAEELQKKGLVVEKGSDIQVRGTYVDVIDSRSKLLSAQIKGDVVDASDRTLFSFSRGVFGDQALASLFGTTGNITPTDDVKKRSEELTKALDNPNTHLDGTRITTEKGTPYAIEVLVMQGGQLVPRSPTIVDGQAFVKINRDEIYAIKLINDTSSEAAVALTIDGLSVFAFSENTNYSQVIIPAKRFGIIKGWHRSNSITDSFQVMEYSKSAVAQKLPTSTSVGVVTATFSVCFPNDVPPPDDEPPSTKVKDKSRAADATGRGPELKEKFTEVQRNFGVVRTTISVRYTK